MAKNKKQHFVPQFYLRNFSADADKKGISLYVLPTGRHVSWAPIKDQAYQDYFYGNGGAEDDLGKLESEASSIITRAIGGTVLPERGSEGHFALLTFTLFQWARTPAMADSSNEQMEKIARMLAREFPDLKDEADDIRVNDREAPLRALQMVAEICPITLDLQWKLLENRSQRPFITSDNPAVAYNQFLEKRNTLASNTGLGCKGLQIFLPLGPRHLLMLYDGEVYRVGGRKRFDTCIEIGREADIDALNVLQAANTDEVLYFGCPADAGYVQAIAGRAAGHRRTERVAVNEHPAIGLDGREGTILHTATVDLRMGLALDFVGLIPAAAGPQLDGRPVQVRNGLVRLFETHRIAGGPCDARKLVDFLRGESST